MGDEQVITNNVIIQDDAKQSIEDYGKDLSKKLKALSIAFAKKDDLDIVCKKHVKEAMKALEARDNERKWLKEAEKIFGASFFGFFTKGFVEAIFVENRMVDGELISCIILGMVGIIMMFHALRT